jgi:hypothetical protein
MKRLILIFLAVFLFGSYINDDLLLIEAKLYPKIIYLMDLNEKKEFLKVAIVVNANTKKIGEKLKDLMKQKNLKIDLIKENKINLNYDAYIFTSKYISKSLLNNLVKNKKVIFTIYPNYVKNVMFSIYIGPKIYPYINPKLLNLSKIKFNPILLKVGKIYEK